MENRGRKTENGESLKQEISNTGSFYDGESLRRVISTGFLKKNVEIRMVLSCTVQLTHIIKNWIIGNAIREF